MQQLLKWMRSLVYPAAVILLVWAGFKIITSPYISESTGDILVVYNGGSGTQDCDTITTQNENESLEALAGLCEAKKSHDHPAVDLLNIGGQDHDESGVNASRVYQLLAARVARGPVLGVISLLTSPDSRPIVRFCRTMQIPLLLAIAANDDLMWPTEDTGGIVFRMVPTNGWQVVNLATWIQGRIQPVQPGQPRIPLRMAVFHEPNSFGEFLQRRLALKLQQLEKKNIVIYPFEVTEHLEFADLMSQLYCMKLDLVVYLGFAPGATDLLNRLSIYKADPKDVSCDIKGRSLSFDDIKVVLASGAYREYLDNTDQYKFRFPVFAMLPTQPAPLPGQPDKPVTRSDYGYDSYTLMGRLAAQGHHKGGGDDLYKILSQPIEHPKTGHIYVFDEHGELTGSKDENMYHPYQLQVRTSGVDEARKQ